ncbi:hypothetical protein [Salinimicrobium flavum]|uniref:Ferredoxin subunit of nitrite reductase or a ring-hydroxylating dioxygenase n=1 Tax=Salinimicrobium flavum TaxID=1737065 RepID=A0ABW5ITW0_9FLAO
MKRSLLCIALSLMFMGCSGDDEIRNNPYLPNLNFTLRLDLSLPEYNNLNFPGNSYTTYNYGINGIVVYNLNNDQYMAFELTDPNHVIQECSWLEVTRTEAKCSCNDGNKYTIITGQRLEGQGEYSLKPYRVRRAGNVLEITN